MRKRRKRKLGFDWHVVGAVPFGGASFELKHHREVEARLFILLAKRRDSGLSSRRVQADGGQVCEESVKLFAGDVVRGGLFFYELVDDFFERGIFSFEIPTLLSEGPKG